MLFLDAIISLSDSLFFDPSSDLCFGALCDLDLALDDLVFAI